MKLFFVQIGKYTRKGSFIEYGHRAVSASDSHTINDLYPFFCSVYKGLDIKVSEAESFADISDSVRPRFPVGIAGDTGYLSGFKINYNESEKALFEECNTIRDTLAEKVSLLEQSIMSRYENLSYIRKDRYGNFNMSLETDCSGTLCRGLPIKSEELFRVVKDGEDEAEKLLIAPPRNNDDDGIPY